MDSRAMLGGIVLGVMGVLAGVAAFLVGRGRTTAVEIALGLVLVVAAGATLTSAAMVRFQAGGRGHLLGVFPLASLLTGIGGLTYGVGLLFSGPQPAVSSVLRFAGTLSFLAGAACAFKRL
jgi:hypothetical protein